MRRAVETALVVAAIAVYLLGWLLIFTYGGIYP